MPKDLERTRIDFENCNLNPEIKRVENILYFNRNITPDRVKEVLSEVVKFHEIYFKSNFNRNGDWLKIKRTKDGNTFNNILFLITEFENMYNDICVELGKELYTGVSVKSMKSKIDEMKNDLIELIYKYKFKIKCLITGDKLKKK